MQVNHVISLLRLMTFQKRKRPGYTPGLNFI